MKNLSLLTWLTQLGLNVALPPTGWISLAYWLKDRFSLGNWVFWIAGGLGLVFALNGLRVSLKAMERLSKDGTEKEKPVSFNDHD